MDVLSDVLAVMRTGEPRSAKMVRSAPWAQWFAPVPGAAGFQVILHGSCWLIRAGAEPLQLNTGDVVFLSHGQGHTLADSPFSSPSTSDGQQTVTLCGAYQLDPARAHPLLLTLPEVIHLPARLGHEVRTAVDLLSAELENPRLGTDALIPALLETLLLYILRTWFDEDPQTTRWASALQDKAVTEALNAIHKNPEEPWTVATLASRAGLSRAPFASRFARKVGQPPLTYLTWWRMTIAAQLLQTTDAPLRTIATKVAYTSEFAFAAAFKRQFAQSPGQYRKEEELNKKSKQGSSLED
ncbi:AraC-like DNA-binding protein [Kibdelosporangium banguiense]|uniref:AraC-like DNA-binding protein n=1 Tax=Kibdelosporangium banguiense TaxID=1365924 RepID=A0ABS4TPN7_9PSEU|nr:AraC family transcriptional regulator [Kibdelosporangium banguiense]MBP2326367.1 AraC-like DNA-binding protein [Kibdelosporangium banguiense]